MNRLVTGMQWMHWLISTPGLGWVLLNGWLCRQWERLRVTEGQDRPELGISIGILLSVLLWGALGLLLWVFICWERLRR